MSETKHTPGPWYWCDGKGESDLEFLTSQSGKICEFGNCEDYYPQCGVLPSEADARLMAAAPELLEALEKALDELGGNDPHDLAYEDSICGYLRAAIAKAKGEQP